MPTLFMLGNLKIQVFAGDHNPAHFHVVSPDREALIRIADFAVIAGALSGREYRLAVEWASSNKERVEHEWHRLNP